MIRYLAAAGVAALLTTGSAHAQGAFNMGSLTQTVSQDAVTQSEARRAGKSASRSSDAAYRARIKPICAERFQFKEAMGDDPEYRDLDRKCRAQGF